MTVASQGVQNPAYRPAPLDDGMPAGATLAPAGVFAPVRWLAGLAWTRHLRAKNLTLSTTSPQFLRIRWKIQQALPLSLICKQKFP
jgi:hypothetical protein